MNLNFNVTGKARKALVNAIAEILGETAEYQGTPSYAYVIGKYTVDKNGTLEGRKNANLEAKLAERGFTADELAEEETPAEIAAETAPETEGEDTPEIAPEIEESDDDGETAPQTEDGEISGENGEISESEEGLTISYPLDGFNPQTLDNLNKMVISKAPLIKKALGADELPVQIDCEEVKFPWFKAGLSSEDINAYAQFICQLCKTAQAKTRVTATAPESFENEKFAIRVWLISLNMKGTEYAHARKILMLNLDGNSGFRYEDKQPRNPRGERSGEPKQVVSVRFTEDILGKLAELASQSNMSRNQLIESVICEYVQAETGAVETAPEGETDSADTEE